MYNDRPKKNFINYDIAQTKLKDHVFQMFIAGKIFEVKILHLLNYVQLFRESKYILLFIKSYHYTYCLIISKYKPIIFLFIFRDKWSSFRSEIHYKKPTNHVQYFWLIPYVLHYMFLGGFYGYISIWVY